MLAERRAEAAGGSPSTPRSFLSRLAASGAAFFTLTLLSAAATLSPDLEIKLAQAADRRGVSAEVLAREAIERAVGYDDWFIREVEAGFAQVEAGRLLDHDAVGARLERKLAEHQSRR